MTIDLLAAQSTAIDIARQAAEVVMQYFGGTLKEISKSSDIDIATEADQGSEALIVEALQVAFPTHHIFGEEGGGYGNSIDKAEYRWYIDPLDGTTNYANHIPFFAISIALTDNKMRPLMGVVYDPMADEMFSAVLGHGATINGTPLHVSGRELLKDCVVSSGFPYNKHTSPENNHKQWGQFLTRVRGVRRMGAAALDLCYVADGRFDGYWESNLGTWDCLAGILCVTEAGGMVSDYQGHNDESIYGGGKIVASNGHIHKQMIDVLNIV